MALPRLAALSLCSSAAHSVMIYLSQGIDMAGVSIFYTYEPVCSFCSICLCPRLFISQTGQQGLATIMKVNSMRTVLGKEGRREKMGQLPVKREDEQVQEKEMSQTLVGGWGPRRGRGRERP